MALKKLVNKVANADPATLGTARKPWVLKQRGNRLKVLL